MQTHHADADRIVITGDLTHWAEVHTHALLRDTIIESDVPVRLTVGNRDERATFRAVFPDLPVGAAGFVNHSEKMDGVDLIYCDTIEPGADVDRSCEGRHNWLAARLDEADQALISSHHNPLFPGAPAEDQIPLNHDGPITDSGSEWHGWANPGEQGRGGFLALTISPGNRC